MEIVRSQRKASSSAAYDVVPTTLPLYRSAPPHEVRLEDFELFAIDRLRGLFSFSTPPHYIINFTFNSDSLSLYPLYLLKH